MDRLTRAEFMFIWQGIIGREQALIEYQAYALWLLYNFRLKRK
jgi:hypothetical protein